MIHFVRKNLTTIQQTLGIEHLFVFKRKKEKTPNLSNHRAILLKKSHCPLPLEMHNKTGLAAGHQANLACSDSSVANVLLSPSSSKSLGEVVLLFD